MSYAGGCSEPYPRAADFSENMLQGAKPPTHPYVLEDREDNELALLWYLFRGFIYRQTLLLD